MSDIILETLLG